MGLSKESVCKYNNVTHQPSVKRIDSVIYLQNQRSKHNIAHVIPNLYGSVVGSA